MESKKRKFKLCMTQNQVVISAMTRMKASEIIKLRSRLKFNISPQLFRSGLNIMIKEREVIFAVVESSAGENPAHWMTSSPTNLCHK